MLSCAQDVGANMRLALKVAGGIGVLLLLATLGLYVAFLFWIADYKRAVAAGSQIAHTKLGDIEYAIVGEGVPVLSIHGSPGGYDVSLAGPKGRPEDFRGRRTIAVSRPGFLRTPLSSGRTPSEQADLYAALLDELKIDSVVVSGISGGGPSALMFALRHPERTRGLVLIVPHLLPKGGDKNYPAPSGIGAHLVEFGSWAGGLVMPLAAGFAVKDFDGNDPVQVAKMKEMLPSFVMTAERGPGRANDKAQYLDFDLGALSLEQMRAPVLLAHGTADATPFEGSAEVAARAPNARLITLEGYGHLVFVAKHKEIDGPVRELIMSLRD
jgi:pimeloyl-ACP methyl ester carboxylesterase